MEVKLSPVVKSSEQATNIKDTAKRFREGTLTHSTCLCGDFNSSYDIHLETRQDAA